MLTVGNLVSDCGLELIAGADGAEQPIRWVHISELEDPTPWLTGGELLLTIAPRPVVLRAPGEVHPRVATQRQHILERDDCHVGDHVRMVETRPLSKDKHFRVLEIVKKASTL